MWNREQRSAPGGRAFLVDAAGQKLELKGNRVYVLGRGEECDVRLEDTEASRRHAKLSVAGDATVVHVEDLRSKNGTFLNERKLAERKKLASGDRIRIGKSVFQIEILDSAIEIQLDTRTTVAKPADGKKA